MAKKKTETVENTEDGTYVTYVGAGADSPRVIMFMGRLKFVRGERTLVTDQECLNKIINNPTFVVGGEVTQEELHDLDESAVEEEKRQQELDSRTNAAFVKKHVGV